MLYTQHLTLLTRTLYLTRIMVGAVVKTDRQRYPILTVMEKRHAIHTA